MSDSKKSTSLICMCINDLITAFNYCIEVQMFLFYILIIYCKNMWNSFYMTPDYTGRWKIY